MPAKKKLLICESHQIVDASYTLTLPEMRLMQLTLARHYQVDGIKEEVFYEVPLQEFADWFGLTLDAAYRELVEACQLLKGRLLILKTKLIDKNAREGRKSIISWVDRVDYIAEESKVYLRWHRDIVPLLNNFGADNPYSKYYLENTCKMRSANSIRLFRLVNKWAKAKRFKVEVGELKRLLGLDEGSYAIFDNFKRKVIAKGVSDINKYSNLQVVVKGIAGNGGRRITHLEFFIVKG